MNTKPKFVHIEKITGKTLFEDGRISLDVLSDGNTYVLEFKPEMQGDLFQCLLPRGSAITGAQSRGFGAEQAELLRSPTGDFALQFLLTGGLSIAIGLPQGLLLNLRDLLNTIEEQSLQ